MATNHAPVSACRDTRDTRDGRSDGGALGLPPGSASTAASAQAAGTGDVLAGSVRLRLPERDLGGERVSGHRGDDRQHVHRQGGVDVQVLHSALCFQLAQGAAHLAGELERLFGCAEILVRPHQERPGVGPRPGFGEQLVMHPDPPRGSKPNVPSEPEAWVDYDGPHRQAPNTGGVRSMAALEVWPPIEDVEPCGAPVALICEIGCRHTRQEIEHGLHAAGVADPIKICLSMDHGCADLSDQTDVDRAASDLEVALDLARQLNTAAVHLFYLGPLALLMRAAARSVLQRRARRR